MNISCYANNKTANTCLECAEQRAENLAILGARSVIELCVGPSLKVLENCYSKWGINVTGNDIDSRWEAFYPKGKWIIDDATKIDTSKFDAAVVAPPLSVGCSGKREHSLSLEKVFPSYYSFTNLKSRIVVYVLPGRTLSLKEDRKQLYKFMSTLAGKLELIPLKNKVTKYVDLYVIG